MLRVAEQYAGTDTGLQRRANEDSLLARAPLFVVADGMGGAQAGEVASRIAVEAFHAGLAHDEAPEEGLVAHALAANARIHELSRANAEQAGMGTTLTAVYVGEDEVGDRPRRGLPRLLPARRGAAAPHRRPLARGRADPRGAPHPRGSRGAPPALDHHPRARAPRRPSRWTPARSARGPGTSTCCAATASPRWSARRASPSSCACTPHARLRDAGEALIAEANRAGGRDNITVILLRLEEVGSGPPGPGGTAEGHATPTRPHARPARHAPSASPPWSHRPLDGDGGRRPHVPTAAARAPRRARRPRRPSSPGAPRAAGCRRRSPATRAPGRSAAAAPRVCPRWSCSPCSGVLAAGGYVAAQSVFFLATNARGLVTMYQGFPYSSRAACDLYSSYYVSGVGASTLSPARRRELLDHTLRSEGDAGSLVRSLELEELSE